MTDNDNRNSWDQQPLQLDEILAELMRATDAAQAIDPHEWLARYPEFAVELQEFFAQQDRLEKLVGSLRHAATKALHVRCPHCHNPIELLDDAALNEISCPSCGSSFSLVGDGTISHHEPGARTLGHFQLLDRVGVGQFGSVWKARDTKLDRDVAVKIPRAGQLDGTQTELFLRDARAAAQLKHPNIVGVHEIGKQDDTVYIVSDFIQGATLKEWMAAKQLTAREIAELCVKIAKALHHAHEAGVIHRDLKPGNIMMDSDGEPHIVDFGLAKREVGEITMTVEGQILGTPAYMPPEQARGEGHTVDRRADIYSLGVILFELLTGELPFRGDKQMLIVQILQDEPPKPRKLDAAVPRDLETICLKCIEKEPSKRYPRAAELCDDLTRCLRGESILARPTGPVVRSLRWAGRNPVASGLIMTCILASILGAALTVSLWYRSRLENVNGQLTTVNDRLGESNERLQDSLMTAEREQANARAHESQAKHERALARKYEYVSQIKFAELALANDNVRSAVAALSRWIPPDNSSEDLRRFEWYYLWEHCHGQVHTLRQHAPGGCLAYTPDGKLLASGDSAGHIIVWDTLLGQMVQEFAVPQAAVVSLAFDKNGRRLHSIDSVNLRTWDLATGKQVDEKKVPQKVLAAEFAEHGQFFGAASDSSDQLAIFSNGLIQQTDVRCRRNMIDTISGRRSLPIFSITTDADRIATASGNEVTVQAFETNERHEFVLQSRDRDVGCLTDTTDGRFILVGETLPRSARNRARDMECKVWVWDAGAKSMKSSFVAHDRPIQLIASGGARIATASEDQTIRVWDLKGSTVPRKPLMTFYGEAKFLSLVFSPDHKQLSAADERGIIRVWNLESGDSTRVLTTDGRIGDVAFCSNGQRIAGRTHGDHLFLWELATGDLLAEFSDFGGTGRCGVSDNGKYISSGTKIIDLEQLTLYRQFDGHPGTRRVLDVEFSPNGNVIARGQVGRPGVAVVLDVESGRTTHTLQMPSADVARSLNNWCTSVAFGPDGDVLATATGDDTDHQGLRPGHVLLWDLASGKSIREYKGHSKSVWRIAFSSDGQLIAAATGNYQGNDLHNEVWIWDVSTAEVVHVLRGHSHCVYDLSFSPDGTRLSSVAAKHWAPSRDNSQGELKLWDVETGQEMLSISSSENLLTTAFDDASKQLAIGSANGTVTIYRPFHNRRLNDSSYP